MVTSTCVEQPVQLFNMLPSPKVTSPARHSMPCNYPETLQSHSIIFPLRLLAIRPPPPSNLSSLNQPSPFPANRHHHPILSFSTTPNRFEASSASSNSRPLLANTVPGASGAVSRRPSALGFPEPFMSTLTSLWEAVVLDRLEDCDWGGESGCIVNTPQR